MAPEFIEFAGKKDYTCFKCKKPIRYAKFAGPDGKLLTKDGEKPFSGERDGKFTSNTGWPTDPFTKLMHECEGDNKIDNIRAGNAKLESVTHNSQTLLEVLTANAEEDEKKDILSYFESGRKSAIKKLARYAGVLSACESVERTEGVFVGMISNQVNED